MYLFPVGKQYEFLNCRMLGITINLLFFSPFKTPLSTTSIHPFFITIIPIVGMDVEYAHFTGGRSRSSPTMAANSIAFYYMLHIGDTCPRVRHLRP